MATVRKKDVRAEWEARARRHKRAQRELLAVLTAAIEDLGAQFELRPVASVEGKQKEFESFWKKVKRYREAGRVTTVEDCFVEVGDIVRARVVCQTLADVQRLERLLDNEDRDSFLIENQFEYHDPSPTGYRGLHLNAKVEVPEDTGRAKVACEVQVATALQFAWGLYTHADFYKGPAVSQVVREVMIQLSELLHVADQVADHLIADVERSRADEAASAKA